MARRSHTPLPQTRSHDRPWSMKLPGFLKAGFVYFLIVFAVGFALAPIRELWAIPEFGERRGELLEMPFILLAMILAARFIVKRYSLPPSTPKRLAAGVIALACLVLAELAVVVGIRGFTLAEYFAARDPVSGAIYVAMLLLFALMPALVRRSPIRRRRKKST